MIIVMRSWWVGARVKQYAFVSAQWKHSLRDGEPLAGHFSCCGQRFPWQVSLNSSFVFGDGFSLTSCVLKTLWCSLLQGLDWSPMTRSWLKTNTKPCESELTVGRHMFQQRHAKCWDCVPPNKGDAGHSLLLSWHPSRAQNSRVVYQPSADITATLRNGPAHILTILNFLMLSCKQEIHILL